MQICSFTNFAEAQKPHSSASHDDLKQQLMQAQSKPSSPTEHVLEKTLTLYKSYVMHGYLSSLPDGELLNGTPKMQDTDLQNKIGKGRQGHTPKLICPGKLIFSYDHKSGQAFVQYVINLSLY